MSIEDSKDLFLEERQKTKSVVLEILEDLEQMPVNFPELELGDDFEYYKAFLSFVIKHEHIDNCDNLAFVFLVHSLKFMLGDEKRIINKVVRSDSARKSAQRSRKFEAMHNEIRRIGESVRHTANEHEITPIVEHRLQKLGYTPTRRTIRTSLQKARIIRTQAERKKGK